METKLIFARLTLVLCICLLPRAMPAVAATKSPVSQGVTEDLSEGVTFTFDIGPGLPQFTFKVIPDPQDDDSYGNAQSTARDIEVFRGGSNQPLQHLTGCDLGEMQVPEKGRDWFRAEDFNFDGYQDIYLMTNWGVTGNYSGCVWLFNPKTAHFDYSKEFSNLAGHSLFPETKTILTFSTGGMASMVHTAQRYKVKNNRPVLIWTEQQDWDSTKEQLHCIRQERRRGKMVTVLDVWQSEDDVEQCVVNRSYFH